METPLSVTNPGAVLTVAAHKFRVGMLMSFGPGKRGVRRIVFTTEHNLYLAPVTWWEYLRSELHYWRLWLKWRLK